MKALNAKLVVVSTPEHGRAAGSADDCADFPVKAMAVLERTASAVVPHMVVAYDFAGSAIAQDCKAQVPDREMRHSDWAEPEKIRCSQWFRYWMGGTRKTLATLLMTAEPLQSEVRFVGEGNNAIMWPAGNRFTIAVSFSGGFITQTERAALPDVFSGTMADLSTRELELGGPIYIYWLHFENTEDFIKALQGYGGVNPQQMYRDMPFGKPGVWVDGAQNSTYDLLRQRGVSSDARRGALMVDQSPSQECLDKRLIGAVYARAADRASELLAQGANPDAQDGGSALHLAAQMVDPVMCKVLLDANADPGAAPEIYVGQERATQMGSMNWPLLDVVERMKKLLPSQDLELVRRLEACLTLLHAAMPMPDHLGEDWQPREAVASRCAGVEWEPEPEPVTDLPEGVPGVASDTSIHSWLQQFKLEAYAQPLADDGYDDLEHIKDLTEEEIAEVLEDVEMKKGHRRTFKREWNKLQ